MNEKQRATWERAKREDPERAMRFGPPNWLVVEESGGDEKKFAETVERLRAEILVREPEVPVNQTSEPDDLTRPLCEDCREMPRAQYRKVCAGCHSKKMRAQRDGVQGEEA